MSSLSSITRKALLREQLEITSRLMEINALLMEEVEQEAPPVQLNVVKRGRKKKDQDLVALGRHNALEYIMGGRRGNKQATQK